MKHGFVAGLILAALALASTWAGAQTVKTQAQLLTEFQTCAAQGLPAGCLTAARLSDIIASAAPSSMGASVTAAGSSQAGATALTNQVNDVTTVAAGTGVALPTAVAGQQVIVCDDGFNPLLVYPASGASIGALGANNPTSVVVGGCTRLVAMSSTAWRVGAAPGAPYGVNVQSGTTYTFSPTDCLQPVRFTSGSQITATVPSTLLAGCVIDAFQDGLGQIVYVGGGTLELFNSANETASAGQYAKVTITIHNAAIGVLTGSLGVVTNAYYVSTTGSDSNAGTLGAPFATLAKARTAMEGSSTNKWTYVRAGSYSPSSDSSAPGGDCTGNIGNVAFSLGPNDAGETVSFYPADGPGTAIIDGGSTAQGNGLGGFACLYGPTSNIRIVGLQLQHFGWIAFDIYGTSAANAITGTIIEENTIHDTYFHTGGCNTFGAVHNWYFAESTLVKNNYFYNIPHKSVSAFGCSSGMNYTGFTVANNVTIDGCSYYSIGPSYPDCGAYYVADNANASNTGLPKSTGIIFFNNLCRDMAIGSTPPPGGHSMCVYIDDDASNTVEEFNLQYGYMAEECYFIHGGDNDLIEWNICDWGTLTSRYTLGYQPNASGGGPTLATTAAGSGSTLTFSAAPQYTTGFYVYDTTHTSALGTGSYPSGCTVTAYASTTVTLSCSATSVQSGDSISFRDPAVNNVVSQNLIVNNAASVAVPGFYGAADGGYPVQTPQTSAANDFFGYGSTAPDHTGSGGAAADSNPQNVSPQLSGCYVSAPGGAVFQLPIGWPSGGIPGGWGPPGFALSVEATYLPSYPSPTC
jgi:hypothetical protein